MVNDPPKSLTNIAYNPVNQKPESQSTAQSKKFL